MVRYGFSLMSFFKLVVGKVSDARETKYKSVLTRTKDGRSGHIDNGDKAMGTWFQRVLGASTRVHAIINGNFFVAKCPF